MGIAGLEDVLAAMAAEWAHRSDADIGDEMIRRLSAGNYIPKNARDLYAAALVREFRVFLGETVPEPPAEGVRVAVLGPGCAQCDRMETDVREVMAEMGLAAQLDHVTDLAAIARYGVVGLPALVVNERVVCVGQAPNRRKIREWLDAARDEKSGKE